MKITKGKVILAIIVIYFIVMGVKNITQEKSDNEILLDKVTIVSNGEVNDKNEGKLVLVTGEISYDGKISFMELEESFETFKVIREVQDYKEKTSPGGSTIHTWENREEGLNSKDYLYTIATETKTLDTKIGDFKLDEIGMEKVNAEKLYINKDIKIGKYEFDGLFYSDLKHEENPKVGDMRITYHYYDMSKNKYISILAKQSGDSFEPYKISDKKEVYNVYNGKVTTKEALAKELNATVKSNTKGKILFILLILGVGIFFIVDSKKKKEDK